MPSGGARANAGRKPGSPTLKGKRIMAVKAENLRTQAVSRSDLEVMLEIRDFWMGIAAHEQREAQAKNRKLDIDLITKALDFAGLMASKRAPFLHPRLAAMMLAAQVVNEITVRGGLPDDQDGGLIAGSVGAGTIELAGSEWSESQTGIGHSPHVPPGPGESVSDPEQEESSPSRKAVG